MSGLEGLGPVVPSVSNAIGLQIRDIECRNVKSSVSLRSIPLIFGKHKAICTQLYFCGLDISMEFQTSGSDYELALLE